MKNCYFKIGSVTQASKAKQELAKHSIYSRIIKITVQEGCTHALEFNCANKSAISYILLRAEINFEEYMP